MYHLITEIREWLKSLRLHKYTKILLELSYEELLQLNDEVLERKNVTLGARGKILKYIGHIKERPRTIKKLGKDIEVRNYQKCLILRQKRCQILILIFGAKIQIVL